jgi:hypothetical protein
MPEPDPNETVFGNVYLLVEQLERDGFKISKSKAYRDKRAGILRVQADGTVTQSDARAYALTLNKVGRNPINLEKLNEEKSKKEVERLSLEIEKLRFTLDKERGKFLLREDFKMEMASRAAVLELGLKHLIQTRAAEFIRLTGGHDGKTGILIDVLNQEIDNLLNDFSDLNRFQVVFME